MTYPQVFNLPCQCKYCHEVRTDYFGMIKCKICNELIPQARVEALPNVQTCVKHSDEKAKDHQPGVVNSLGLHEKYFPEGR